MITSRSNPLLRYVRSLHRRRARYQERAFIVEGARAISDAISAGAQPTHILFEQDWSSDRAELSGQLSRLSPSTLHPVESSLFADLADTVTPSGILAIFRFPDVQVSTGVPLIVVADGLRDPGNLGTLLRSAAAAGATRIVLAENTVDPFNPKVVRAGMGAHFRLPIHGWHDDTVEALTKSVSHRVLAESGDHPPPEALDWTTPSLLVIGSEATGPGDVGRELATQRVSVPLHADVESLNAGVAASVILFEAARQRRILSHLASNGGVRRSSY